MINEIIYQLSLQGLQRKGNQWNFRCNVCGDSKTDNSKKRAWFFQKKSKWMFHCFNCSTSHSFRNYVKYYHSEAYKN